MNNLILKIFLPNGTKEVLLGNTNGQLFDEAIARGAIRALDCHNIPYILLMGEWIAMPWEGAI